MKARFCIPSGMPRSVENNAIPNLQAAGLQPAVITGCIPDGMQMPRMDTPSSTERYSLTGIGSTINLQK
jgi:hypothetical protein